MSTTSLQALKAQILDDLLAATLDFDEAIEMGSVEDFVSAFSRFRREAINRIKKAETEGERP